MDLWTNRGTTQCKNMGKAALALYVVFPMLDEVHHICICAETFAQTLLK